MKVKIIKDSSIDRLEKKINEFITNVQVIDIKFINSEYHTSVLIMYHEIILGED